ncbi:Co2+/Mg2+ efflux protein ApaG [Vulgatibacter sp.]|uniref:Co2+/Mg2+ efflux protein ApaG n=1 Tax=Vulgatibacter sp. TaxID=1971226 RepID=UPI003566B83C
MSVATTEGIRVEVQPEYWEERSAPEQGRFAFTYSVTISNTGSEPAQLLRRHWKIQDGTGEVQEVEGEGVVGKQPRLGPGEFFEYTSWVPLATPIGTMRGTFLMERPDGTQFRAEVPEFVLTVAHALH